MKTIFLHMRAADGGYTLRTDLNPAYYMGFSAYKKMLKRLHDDCFLADYLDYLDAQSECLYAVSPAEKAGMYRWNKTHLSEKDARKCFQRADELITSERMRYQYTGIRNERNFGEEN